MSNNYLCVPPALRDALFEGEKEYLNSLSWEDAKQEYKQLEKSLKQRTLIERMKQ